MRSKNKAWGAIIMPVFIVSISGIALYARGINSYAELEGDFPRKTAFQLGLFVLGMAYWLIAFTLPAIIAVSSGDYSHFERDSEKRVDD